MIMSKYTLRTHTETIGDRVLTADAHFDFVQATVSHPKLYDICKKHLAVARVDILIEINLKQNVGHKFKCLKVRNFE